MMRLLQGRLPLDDILTRFWVHLPSKCVCRLEPTVEMLQHVFMLGDVAKAVWKYFGSLSGLNWAQEHLSIQLVNC